MIRRPPRSTRFPYTTLIRSMTFSENPVGVLAAYCEHLEIPFRPNDLSWQPGEVREWESWEGWHEAAQQSTGIDRKSTRLNSSHANISYAAFCLKKKNHYFAI